MKVIYITAGAAGMYCGSCLRDNTLVRTLRAHGCDIQLVPVYTPIKTDEEDASEDRVFVGGINSYLQQKIPLLRYAPAFVDRWLNHPAVIRRLVGGNVKIKAAELGELAVSMIAGEQGGQKKEMRHLVEWLRHQRPQLVNLTNLLIAGFVPMLKRELDIPVVVTLQGDDLFLGELIEPHRSQFMKQLRVLANSIDAFVVNSNFYAAKMQQLLDAPADKFHVVPLGIDCTDFADLPGDRGESIADGAPLVGYFARISPEKGFGVLTDAFIALRQLPGMENCRLKAGGWLGAADQEFFSACTKRLEKAGVLPFFEHVGAPDRAGKLEFLRSIDALCVPTIYEEPKGIFALEAMACGKPVVVPQHGAFSELLERTGGGVLVPPNNAKATALALAELFADPANCVALGKDGRQGVFANATAEIMAAATLKVYNQILGTSQ